MPNLLQSQAIYPFLNMMAAGLLQQCSNVPHIPIINNQSVSPTCNSNNDSQNCQMETQTRNPNIDSLTRNATLTPHSLSTSAMVISQPECGHVA